jgi:hypothetical protein
LAPRLGEPLTACTGAPPAGLRTAPRGHHSSRCASSIHSGQCDTPVADREVGLQVDDGRAIKGVDVPYPHDALLLVDPGDLAGGDGDRVGAVLRPTGKDTGDPSVGVGRLALHDVAVLLFVVPVRPPHHDDVAELIELLQGRPEGFQDLEGTLLLGPADVANRPHGETLSSVSRRLSHRNLLAISRNACPHSTRGPRTVGRRAERAVPPGKGYHSVTRSS